MRSEDLIGQSQLGKYILTFQKLIDRINSMCLALSSIKRKSRSTARVKKVIIGLQDLIPIPHSSHSASYKDIAVCAAIQNNGCPNPTKHSLLEIGSRVGRNQTNVMRICDRWLQQGTMDRSHPPQCTTSREDRQIVRMAVTIALSHHEP
ncbi:hypothetical protein TNCV_2400731 [Trichonephila clavipes]|nr:hypothetical protein TNCV_2400731 [Trichonephila clavipes]